MGQNGADWQTISRALCPEMWLTDLKARDRAYQKVKRLVHRGRILATSSPESIDNLSGGKKSDDKK